MKDCPAELPKMAPAGCQESLLTEPEVNSKGQANLLSMALTTSWSVIARACHPSWQLSVTVRKGCPFPSLPQPLGALLSTPSQGLQSLRRKSITPHLTSREDEDVFPVGTHTYTSVRYQHLSHPESKTQHHTSCQQQNQLHPR